MTINMSINLIKSNKILYIILSLPIYPIFLLPKFAKNINLCYYLHSPLFKACAKSLGAKRKDFSCNVYLKV